MNTRMSWLVAVVMVASAGNLFAANPADLTVFERFSLDGYLKLIYEEDGKTAFVALPPFHNDFAVSVQAWQNEEGDCSKYTGRLIKRFSPSFDAVLMSDFISKKGVSDIASRLVFDLHGDVFGLPAGIGLYLPLNEEENVRVGPRIGFREFTGYLTMAEEGKYLSGISYAKSGFKVELAYSNEDIWYVRASKSFKTAIGKVCPEIRMRFLPNDQIFGVGLLVFF